jgi:hypothetical protein
MEDNVQNFLKVDFQLPDHAVELGRAEEMIDNLKHMLESLGEKSMIDDASHDYIYNEIIRVLDYVGKLSLPAFAIESGLEAMYTKHYRSAPELGKKLWLDHYEKIHYPYNLLKNRCYRLLTEVDRMYIKKFDKNPPNWKI